MAARASSGGQSARIICTHVGKLKPNLHFLIYPIMTSVRKTTEDGNK
jgi:hypothetical protein